MNQPEIHEPVYPQTAHGAGQALDEAGQADWDRLLKTPARRRRRESWVLVAFGIFALTLLLLAYLGLRQDGTGPIYAFKHGRIILSIAALITLFVGLLRSVLFRPLLRPSRIQAFACLAITIGVINFPIPFPSTRAGRPSEVEFHLPVQGEWTVVWGGESSSGNRLARDRPDRRWGLDLVVTDDSGMSYKEAGTRLADYYAYDRPVLAPCDGVVVVAWNRMGDNPPGSNRPVSQEFGNHLVIEVADSEYLFLSHLRGGSTLVSEGDRVQRGQELARVGNSGFSKFTTEPHLALHLQTTPVPHLGQAIPWSFHDYLTDGFPTSSGLPLGGVSADGRYVGERIQRAE